MKLLIAAATAFLCGSTFALTVIFPGAVVTATMDIAHLQICDRRAEADRLRQAVARSIEDSPYEFEKLYERFEKDVRVVTEFATPTSRAEKESKCQRAVDVARSVKDVQRAKWGKAR